MAQVETLLNEPAAEVKYIDENSRLLSEMIRRYGGMDECSFFARRGFEINRKVTRDSYSDYLYQARQIPRVSREEELELPRIMRAGMQAQRILGEEGPTTKASEDLRAAAIAGTIAYLNYHESFQMLVVGAIGPFIRPELDSMDLILAGNTGLRRAIEMFDPERGNGFIPYAKPHIKRVVMLEFRQKSSTLKLSQDLLANIRELARDVDVFILENHRTPTPSEMEQLDYSPETVMAYLKEGNRTKSLEELEKIDHLPAPAWVNTEELAAKARVERLLETIDFSSLNEREKLLLSLHIGLVVEGLELKEVYKIGEKRKVGRAILERAIQEGGLKQTEIADLIGLKSGRVSKIINNAYGKIRQQFQETGTEQFKV